MAGDRSKQRLTTTFAVTAAMALVWVSAMSARQVDQVIVTPEDNWVGILFPSKTDSFEFGVKFESQGFDEEHFEFECLQSSHFSSCTTNPQSADLSPDDSVGVWVKYTTSSTAPVGGAEIELEATSFTYSDTGKINFTLSSPVGVVAKTSTSPIVEGSSVQTATFDVKNLSGATRSFTAVCNWDPANCETSDTTWSLFAGSFKTITTTFVAGSGVSTWPLELAVTSGPYTGSDEHDITLTDHQPANLYPTRQVVYVAPNDNNVRDTFAIRLPGAASGEWFDLEHDCPTSGNAVKGCLFPIDSVFGSNVTDSLVLEFDHGSASDTTVVTVTATNAGQTIEVSTELTVIATDEILVDVEGANPGLEIDKSACPNFSVGAVAIVCDGFQITYPLAPVTRLNREYQLGLIYNSSDLSPSGVVHADVVLPSDAAKPSELDITFTVGSTVYPTQTFPDSLYEVGERTRFGYNWWFWPFPTTYDVLEYSVEVDPVGGSLATVTSSGYMTAVDHRYRFGQGWWLAGYENLRLEIDIGSSLGDTVLVWNGGDGSARVYTPAGADKWVAETRARPDTITKSGSDEYVRTTVAGDTVRYDETGLHIETIDRNGNTTLFDHTFVNDTASGGMYRPTSIKAPIEGSGTEEIADLHYDAGSGALDSIRIVDEVGGWSTYVIHTTVNPWGFSPIDSIDAPGDLRTRFVRDTVTSPDGTRTIIDRGSGVAFESSGVRVINEPDDDTLTYVHRGHIWVGANTAGGWRAPRPVEELYSVLIGPSSDTTLFYTTGWGAVRGIRDALGNETWIERDDPDFPGLPTLVRHPNGWEMATEYDSDGLVETVTDRSTGAITRYEWDTKWSSPTSVTSPTGVETILTYDANNGNLLTQRVGAETTTFTYNTEGQVIRVLDPLSQRDTIVYDSLGNLKSQKSPLGHEVSFVRDYLGRVTETTSPIDGTYTTTSTTTYDVMGRVTETETTNSRDDYWTRVHTAYDSVGRPISRIAFGDTTDAAQDSLQAGYETWAYDGFGRVIAQQSGPKLDSMAYDDAGNVEEIWTRRTLVYTDTVRMEYDALGRVTKRHIPSVTDNGTQGEVDSIPYYSSGLTIPADSVMYSYDVMGNADTITNRFAKITRTYALNGQLESEQQALAEYNDLTDFGTHVYDLLYRYDLDGKRVVLGHPTWLSGGTDSTTYVYDSSARLRTITGPLGDEYTYTYDAGSRITSRTFPGGTGVNATFWGYDIDDRLTSHHIEVGGDTVIDATVTRLDNGLVESIGGSSTSDVTYTGLGAVTENYGLAWEGAATDELFVMDPFGAQLRRSTPLGELAHDSAAFINTVDDHGRITATDEEWAHSQYSRPADWDEGYSIFQYDSAGNRTGHRKDEPVHAFSEGQGGLSATKYATRREESGAIYGADGHLMVYQINRDTVLHDTIAPYDADIEAASWGAYEEYWYDGLGRRVLKRSRQDDPHCEVASRCHSTIERFVWDGQQILWELKQDDAGDVKDPGQGPQSGHIGYIHGGDIDAPIAMIRNDSTVVLHQNWRGHYAFSTDEDGDYTTCTPEGGTCTSVAWPAGNYVTFANSPGRDTPYWYGSLVYDQRDATGLSYRRNRYYDGATGQFTQTDPIGMAGGLNTYGYAGGDPINFADPFGLSADTLEIDENIRTEVEDCRAAAAACADQLAQLESSDEYWTIAAGEVGPQSSDPGCTQFIVGCTVASATSGVPGHGPGGRILIDPNDFATAASALGIPVTFDAVITHELAHALGCLTEACAILVENQARGQLNLPLRR